MSDTVDDHLGETIRHVQFDSRKGRSSRPIPGVGRAYFNTRTRWFSLSPMYHHALGIDKHAVGPGQTGIAVDRRRARHAPCRRQRRSG